jgi:hypothetical protein
MDVEHSLTISGASIMGGMRGVTALTMEGVSTSKTKVDITRVQGATSQTTAFFIYILYHNALYSMKFSFIQIFP